MNRTLYVLTLAPIEQRYSKQWYTYWKKAFSKYFDNEKVIRMTLYSDTDVLGSIVMAEKLQANLVLTPLINLGNASSTLTHRIPNAKKIQEAINECILSNLKLKGYHQVLVFFL